MKSFIIRNLIKFMERFLINHYGKLDYQYLYEKFYFISLKGKNIYPGEMFNNGEIIVMKKISLNCDSNAVIFDVGANVGNYTLELAKVFNVDQKNYSFEPSKVSYN